MWQKIKCFFGIHLLNLSDTIFCGSCDKELVGFISCNCIYCNKEVLVKHKYSKRDIVIKDEILKKHTEAIKKDIEEYRKNYSAFNFCNSSMVDAGSNHYDGMDVPTREELNDAIEKQSKLHNLSDEEFNQYLKDKYHYDILAPSKVKISKEEYQDLLAYSGKLDEDDDIDELWDELQEDKK
jgi:hypothetical protein